MTTAAWLVFAETVAVAIVAWVAVVTDRRPLEYFAKPAVMVGLFAVALAAHRSATSNAFVRDRSCVGSPQ